MVPQALKAMIVNIHLFKMVVLLYLSDLFFWMVSLKAIKILIVRACYNWMFGDVESCLLTRTKWKYVAIGQKKGCLVLGAVTKIHLAKN